MKKIVNKNYKFIEFLLIMILFEPTIFVKYSKINALFVFGACISFIYIFLIQVKTEKISIFSIELIFFRIIYIFITLINKGDILKIGYQSIIIISLCLYAENYAKKSKFCCFLQILTDICRIYLIINIITYICYPDGLYLNEKYIFFLGYRTRFTEYVFLMIPLAIYQYRINKNRKIIFIDFIIIFLTIKLPKISTAMIGCIVLIAGYLMVSKIKNFNFKVLLYLAFIFNVSIIVFRIQYLFTFLIENILGKSVNLTYRTVIWDNSYKYIFNKMLFIGNGYPDNGNFILWSGRLWQAHNQILQLLYEVGILGCTVFCDICFKVQKKINIIYAKDKNILIFSMALFAFYIMMITEIYSYYLPFYALILSIYFFDKVQKEEGLIKNDRK